MDRDNSGMVINLALDVGCLVHILLFHLLGSTSLPCYKQRIKMVLIAHTGWQQLNELMCVNC